MRRRGGVDTPKEEFIQLDYTNGRYNKTDNKFK